MPELCRFFGIVITMYYNDHPPAHIHLRYGACRARMSLEDGTLLDGALPRQALNRVRLWRDRHEQELFENWRRAVNREPLLPIEPLAN